MESLGKQLEEGIDASYNWSSSLENLLARNAGLQDVNSTAMQV